MSFIMALSLICFQQNIDLNIRSAFYSTIRVELKHLIGTCKYLTDWRVKSTVAIVLISITGKKIITYLTNTIKVNTDRMFIKSYGS